MDSPKPRPPVQKPTESKSSPVEQVSVPETATKPEVKPPFVLKPHLTTKPFRSHAGLLDLKKNLKK